MEFEDLSHLYIGCKAKDTFNDVILDWDIKNAHMYSESIDQIKPILRPLSDMAEDEVKEVDRHGAEGWHTIAKGEPVSTGNSFEMVGLAVTHRQARETAYLLSKHFDLFGLIASGQAIDATTLTPNPYHHV